MAHKSETPAPVSRLLTLQARSPLVESSPLPRQRGPGPRRHSVVRGEAAGARAGQPRVGAAVEGGGLLAQLPALQPHVSVVTLLSRTLHVSLLYLVPPSWSVIQFVAAFPSVFPIPLPAQPPSL